MKKKGEIMADYLINFSEAQKIKASEVNSNFQYILDKTTDNADRLENYIDTELAKNTANTESSVSTLKSSVDTSIDSLTTKINNKVFTYVNKYVEIGIGTTSLSSYLPNDSKKYLVWVRGRCTGQSANNNLYASSDIASNIIVAGMGYDSGRSDSSASTAVVPVGSGRKITLSLSGGSSESTALLGYLGV
jgi:hypothetical protein